MNKRRGSPNLICNPFYRELDLSERMSFLPGQIHSGLVIYPTYTPKVLEILKSDPKENTIAVNIAPFSPRLKSHYPIKGIDLEEDEFLFIYQGKIRPIIIAGYTEATWINEEKPQKLYLCVPIFTFKNRHTQEMVIKSQAFQYPSLFYMPPDTVGLNEESVARFEMIQPITKGALQPLMSSDHKPLALSDEAYFYFINHISNFLLRKPYDEDIDGLINLYREELLTRFLAEPTGLS